jgi:ribosome-associated protein
LIPLLTASQAEPAKSPKRGKKLVPPSALPVEVPALTALQVILTALDDSKAENITPIDLAGKTSIADHMVVASGRADRHVGAIADHVVSRLRDEGFGMAKVEGMPLCEWVLIDAGDIIVHVFKPDIRAFYNLEKMWSGDRPDEQSYKDVLMSR